MGMEFSEMKHWDQVGWQHQPTYTRIKEIRGLLNKEFVSEVEQDPVLQERLHIFHSHIFADEDTVLEIRNMLISNPEVCLKHLGALGGAINYLVRATHTEGVLNRVEELAYKANGIGVASFVGDYPMKGVYNLLGWKPLEFDYRQVLKNLYTEDSSLIEATTNYAKAEAAKRMLGCIQHPEIPLDIWSLEEIREQSLVEIVRTRDGGFRATAPTSDSELFVIYKYLPGLNLPLPGIAVMPTVSRL